MEVTTKMLYLCPVKIKVKAFSVFYLAKIQIKMKLTKEARKKMLDKTIARALEDKLNVSYWTLVKWRSMNDTPLYHRSEAIRDKVIEVLKMTEEEAFTENEE